MGYSGRFAQTLETFLVALKLGLTSFGGPAAHLGYFHNEYVTRRKWLDDRTFADLAALSQVIPGPASSQLGVAIGTIRAGWLGGLLTLVGFTLPSALILIFFAFFLQHADIARSGWIHGLKLVAVAVVAHAVWTMGKRLLTDRFTATVAVLALVALLLWSSALATPLVMLASSLAGLIWGPRGQLQTLEPTRLPFRRRSSVLLLVLFTGFLIALPLLKQSTGHPLAALADSFYRAGSLVFGGGHVVLPLLEKELVPQGLISRESFLAGYGAAQTIPGPLFSFAGFAGAMAAGWAGAFIALSALFLPAVFLIWGTLPFWDRLRRNARIQGALAGINAAVVGLLLAALYDPLGKSAIFGAFDLAVAAVLAAGLLLWRFPPWLVVLLGACTGAAGEVWGLGNFF